MVRQRTEVQQGRPIASHSKGQERRGGGSSSFLLTEVPPPADGGSSPARDNGGGGKSKKDALGPLAHSTTTDVAPWPLDVSPHSSPARSHHVRKPQQVDKDEALLAEMSAAQKIVNEKYWANVRREKHRMEAMLKDVKCKLRERLIAAGSAEEELDEERILSEASSSPQRSSLTATQPPQNNDNSVARKRREEEKSSRPSALMALDPAIADFVIGGTVRRAHLPRNFRQQRGGGKDGGEAERPAFR